jgi:hypothetical protein
MGDEFSEMVDCWKVNYGLADKSPAEAMRWWESENRGCAPAGAVAALGLCLIEIERLTNLLMQCDHPECAGLSNPANGKEEK